MIQLNCPTWGMVVSDTYNDNGDSPFWTLGVGYLSLVNIVTVNETVNKISCFDDYG
jgi:hypothetical protein